MSKLPLAGVRVADFCWIGAGSNTTKILADLGADVIRIESSTRLDSLRMAAPYKDRKPGVNRSGYFADRNTSKRSVTINMKHRRALELIKKLIMQSDIVANNFTPDVMEKFGLGYSAVRAMKPDIIYLAMSMHGAQGPERGYLGYGAIMTSLTGLQHLTGLPGREPAGTGTNYPDHIPNPCHAAFALLAALRYRRRTGRGQYIDLAQLEPTVALLGPTILDFTVNGRNRERNGNRHDWAAPHGVYPCAGADRWIAIAAMTDAHWAALIEVLGSPAWAVVDRWMSVVARHRDSAELDRLLGLETARWSGEALMAALQARDVPAGVVQNAEDVIRRDPQLAHRGHWIMMNHAEMGEAIYNAPPFRFSRTPVQLRSPAPLLGEHTREICVELLGISDADVDELMAQEVLK
ncbi:MAG: CoA transferase [Betaproteobacteria bacterium]|nr:CoA transferase [Betaproteobacteria bacterium]